MTADKNSTDDNNVDKIDSDDNSTDKIDTDDAQEVGTGKTGAEKIDAEKVDAEKADAAASDDVTERQAPRTKSARAAARRSSAAADGTPQETAAQKAEGGASGDAAEPEKKERKGSRQVSVTISAAGILKVLAGIVVVALIVGVGLLGWGYYRDQEKLAAFDDAKSASSVFTVKLVSTMNSDAVGDMKTLLGPLSTGEFRQNLEREQTDGSKALRDLNVKATPTVKSVSVESFDADRASTAVLVEVSGTSTIAPSGGKELMLVWLNLVKEDGSWKVSKLSGAQAGLGQQQGASGPAADTQGGSQSPAPAAPSPAAPAPAPGG
ncbi:MULTISPECIES: hypothetical protein [Gordonia]|uniref:hypothetical protein n=1 Tax=Gordonia TaxID=2053 RepID=UPI00257D67FF|nr:MULTISPECIES: hypothetical protein [Gordonia]